MCYNSEGHQHRRDPSPNDTSPKCAPALWSWTWQSQGRVMQLLGCTSSVRDIPGKLHLLHCGHEPAMVVKVPSSPQGPVVPGGAAGNARCVPQGLSWMTELGGGEQRTHSQCVQMGFINQAPTAPLH